MAALPVRVSQRLNMGLKRFQPVIANAKGRDVNESDTVTIIMDVLSEIFGFDKYAEITSEYAIKGTYVDLAVKLDGKLHLLVEVKAIGQSLDEKHAKQAVDYAANQGVEWVVLTNGVHWKAYKVTFEKPIGQELVIDFDLLLLNPRKDTDLELLYPLTREGFLKSALQTQHEQKQATNRYVLGAILLTDQVVEVVRREVRRLSPGVKSDLEELRQLIQQEVLKREVVDGEQATTARAKVKRAAARRLRINGTPDKTSPEDLPTTQP